MATPNKLTLVPYLQHWDHLARTVSIRLLVAPTGDPLSPLVPAPAGVPAFADAGFAFSVSLSDSAAALPQRGAVDQVVILPGGGPTITHPHSRPIFTAIKEALEIPDTPAADTFSPQDRDLGRQLRKYLPVSYRQSFGFVKPRTSLALIDDTYQCLMRCPPDPVVPPPPMVIGWGEAIAFAMRQPRLAEALGLIVELDIPLDAAPRLEHGGWLWVDLAPSSDYAAQASTAGFLRTFATRVPELPVGTGRPVFTPVVVPVSADATAAASLGNFDKVFIEAVRFDDGFSKIVHARQPLSADILDESGDGAPIGRDEGVQLGWDDEDIVEGQNRAMGAPPAGEDPVFAPRGIFGYRVDVRAAGGTTWTSLSRVEAGLDLGVDLGSAVEERWTEVAPGEHSGQLWLPAWFVNWRGGSLIASTVDDQRLMNTPPGRPQPLVPVDADDVELRYGRSYEFRVRLADLTGGGPETGDSPVRIGEAPVTQLRMKRHRRPSNVVVDVYSPPADGSVASLRVRRPRLGYPEAVFAAGAPARTALLSQIAANDTGVPADAVAPTIADPDAIFLDIQVLVRPPAFDPIADVEGFVEWYRTTRAFPTDPDTALDLAFDWLDAADYASLDVSAQLGADGTVTGPLTVVTARDVRIAIRALGRNDLTYFGSQAARLGPVVDIDLHAIASAAAETGILRPLAPSDELRSVFLRPDPIGSRAEVRAVVAQNESSPVLLGRLAAALDLVADGPLLAGRPGDRIVFGCAGLTHHAAPDGSSIELGNPEELAGQWINAVQVVFDRDWTWRGAGSPTLQLTRTVGLPDAPGAIDQTIGVGTIELMNAINVQAANDADRSSIRFVFLDALPPPMGPDGLPYEVDVAYRFRVRFEGGGGIERTIATHLPIVTPPTQAPKVVAAGVTLTAYERDSEYATTGSRVRRLWLEFAEPTADKRDAYFVRVLSSAPDPLLLPHAEPVADPAVLEQTPLDPELVRIITPGPGPGSRRSRDDAAAGAEPQ